MTVSKLWNDTIHETVRSYRIRQSNNITVIITKHDYFKSHFFPSAIIEWRFGYKIQISESIDIFKESILTFVQQAANSRSNYYNPRVLELSLQLRLGLSHLCKHRFNQSMAFKVLLLMHFPSVGIGEIEACCHYLLHCSDYSTQKLDLLNSIRNIDSSILQKNNMNITLTILFGNNSYDSFKNSDYLR